MYVEANDSSAAQTRALAEALRGRHYDPFGMNLLTRSAARLAPLMPVEALDWGVRMAAGTMGVPVQDALKVDAEEMARWVTRMYRDDAADTILLGAPSGGVSHIGSIMNAPFLTTHFLVCFSHLRPVDDVMATLSVGRVLGGQIAKRNPLLHLVNHFDPIHDRPVLVFINHIRPKLIGMPDAYGAFIKKRLRPGGTMAVINCTYPWKQYRVAPRVSFQVGGLGGVSDDEFLDGGPRIREYRKKQGSPGDGWKLPENMYPLESMPESEWGCMPEFVDSAREYASRNGVRLVVLTADHPETFSELAFNLHLEASRRDGEEPQYVFADCFNQLDPLSNLKARILPLWLPYYCDRTFEYARRMMSDHIDHDMRMLLTLHPSFADPFDMTPLKDWMGVFTTFAPPILIGVDPKRFPYDIQYAIDFGRQIRRFSEIHRDPVRARLGADDLVDIARTLGIEVT